MTLELDNPIQKKVIEIKVNKLELNFDSSVALLSYSLIYEDGSEQGQPVLIFEDWTEQDEDGHFVSHPDFTNFYANYISHQYLYNKIMEKEQLQGTYNPEGEPQ